MKDLLLERTSFLYADLYSSVETVKQKNGWSFCREQCFVDYTVKASDGGHLS